MSHNRHDTLCSAGGLGAGSESGRGGTVLARLLGPVAHDLAVDGAADAVVQLGVQLRQRVRLVDRGLGEIPDSCRLHDVPDDELLDGLVLGHAARAVGAAHGVHVTSALLRATSIPALLRHF